MRRHYNSIKKTFNSGGLLTVQRRVWWHVGRGSNRLPTEDDVAQIKGVLSSFKVWLKSTLIIQPPPTRPHLLIEPLPEFLGPKYFEATTERKRE